MGRSAEKLYYSTEIICPKYPTISGFGIDPNELQLPISSLNPEKPSSYNNDHICWTKKQFGVLAIYQTCRDLELSQFAMLIDQHQWRHDNYEPSDLPTLTQAMDRIVAAKDCGERLRYGSCNNPKFVDLSDGLMKIVHREYNSQSHLL